MDNTEALSAALAKHDLTTSDLPGIEEAWGSTFDELDEPAPESHITVLRELFPEGIGQYDNVYVTGFTPHSDGSGKVSINVWDDDGDVDDWDDPDIIHLTKLLSGDAMTRFLIAYENAGVLRERSRLMMERLEYAEGQNPVWWVLGSASNGSASNAEAYRDAIRNECRASAAYVRTEIVESCAKLLLDWMQTRQMPGALKDSKLTVPGTAAWRSIPDGGHGIALRDVQRAVAKVAETTPEFERIHSAWEEANALPKGPLREYLLGTRPTRSIDTYVGAGRNKRFTKKAYTPTPELQQDHNHIVASHSAATKDFDALLADVRRVAIDSRGDLNALRTDLERMRAAKMDAWFAGYPGEREERLLPTDSEPRLGF